MPPEAKESLTAIFSDLVRGSRLLARQEFEASMLIYAATMVFSVVCIAVAWNSGERYKSATVIFCSINVAFTILRVRHAWQAFRLNKAQWRREK